MVNTSHYVRPGEGRQQPTTYAPAFLGLIWLAVSLFMYWYNKP